MLRLTEGFKVWGSFLLFVPFVFWFFSSGRLLLLVDVAPLVFGRLLVVCWSFVGRVLVVFFKYQMKPVESDALVPFMKVWGSNSIG